VKGFLVDSSLGRTSLDGEGATVGVVRMDPDKAYGAIPKLLQAYIKWHNENAWEEIKQRIDYIYDGLSQAMDPLEETCFEVQLRSEVEKGKKLLFKPNLVGVMAIDPVTHGEGNSTIACTQWPFVAALMRWFHDRLDISYHQMALGEAGTSVNGAAEMCTRVFGQGRRVTPEALIEGRWGNSYGGWGFYFVRQYLSERHETGHIDDPRQGFAESVAGEYVPPGQAGARLLVYDLNRLSDPVSQRGTGLPPRGREVPVPDGANFKQIMLHKVVVGGDPNDAQDREDYPGCVLVNVPRLKVHIQALFTNAIKNLGIGLYPMLVTEDGKPDSTNWKYCLPYGPIPRLKDKIPHYVWFPKFDPESGMPLRDENGAFVVTKTAGLSGTMVDMLKALQHQGVFAVHVVDAIEAINLCHDFHTYAAKVPEGYAFAALDPVALDLLCARYMFKNVPMAEGQRLRAEGKVTVDFVQRVPAPRVEGANIVTGEGFDAPLGRYSLFRYAEGRGLGQQAYHAVGWNTVNGRSIASLQGHLGEVDGSRFSELITNMLYYDVFKLLWDLQVTILGYVTASDQLTGSSYLRELLEAFDENGDGVLDYDETGKKRLWAAGVLGDGDNSHTVDNYAYLWRSFRTTAQHLKYSSGKWNAEGADFSRNTRLTSACATAFSMSQAPVEAKDPLFPSMTWGRGKWPSLQYAYQVAIGRAIYGSEYPLGAGSAGLYAQALQYADQALGSGHYTAGETPGLTATALNGYLAAVSHGALPLPFVLYVPKGFGKVDDRSMPNVEETDDPARVFTAVFNSGQEVW